ncbi:Hypothetical predicted protein, partial [Paramuricea clavata]
KLIKAVIGLVGQVFTAALSNPATEEYQKAKNAIEQAIMSVFDTIQSFRSVSLTGFRITSRKFTSDFAALHFKSVAIIYISFPPSHPNGRYKPMEQLRHLHVNLATNLFPARNQSGAYVRPLYYEINDDHSPNHARRTVLGKYTFLPEKKGNHLEMSYARCLQRHTSNIGNSKIETLSHRNSLTTISSSRVFQSFTACVIGMKRGR